MLAELVDELRRHGIRLVLARDIGQVRDFLGQMGEPTAPAYPSVEAAVDALAPRQLNHTVRMMPPSARLDDAGGNRMRGGSPCSC